MQYVTTFHLFWNHFRILFYISGGRKEKDRRGRKITMGKRSKFKVFRTPQGVGRTRGKETQRTRKEGRRRKITICTIRRRFRETSGRIQEKSQGS